LPETPENVHNFDIVGRRALALIPTLREAGIQMPEIEEVSGKVAVSLGPQFCVAYSISFG
jgi:hypothetical protein